MTPKQLANVLIKILGVSFLLNAISAVPYEITIWTTLWLPAGTSSTLHDTFTRQAITTIVSNGARDVLELGIGIFVIIKSRKIAEYLFKNEAE